MFALAVGISQKYCIYYCINSIWVERTMNKSDVNALEKTLFQLPADQKYYIANQLLNQTSTPKRRHC